MNRCVGFLKDWGRDELRGLSAGGMGVLLRLIEMGVEREDAVVDCGGDLTAMAMMCRMNRESFREYVEELRRAGLVRVSVNVGNEMWLRVFPLRPARVKRMRDDRRRKMRKVKGVRDER